MARRFWRAKGRSQRPDRSEGAGPREERPALLEELEPRILLSTLTGADVDEAVAGEALEAPLFADVGASEPEASGAKAAAAE
jgi:hypothetical protein